jgi:hypothetical protein
MDIGPVWKVESGNLSMRKWKVGEFNELSNSFQNEAEHTTLSCPEIQGATFLLRHTLVVY